MPPGRIETRAFIEKQNSRDALPCAEPRASGPEANGRPLGDGRAERAAGPTVLLLTLTTRPPGPASGTSSSPSSRSRRPTHHRRLRGSRSVRSPSIEIIAALARLRAAGPLVSARARDGAALTGDPEVATNGGGRRLGSTGEERRAPRPVPPAAGERVQHAPSRCTGGPGDQPRGPRLAAAHPKWRPPWPSGRRGG